jgi:hypothetical protein
MDLMLSREIMKKNFVSFSHGHGGLIEVVADPRPAPILGNGHGAGDAPEGSHCDEYTISERMLVRSRTM